MSDRAGQQWDGIEENPAFRICFVRHAESEINIMPELEIPRHALPPDSGVTYPLTRKGMQQASAIAQRLAGERLIAVYSSTRMRCVQTATAIALPHEIPVRPMDDLVEIAFVDPAASMGMIEEDDVRAVMGRWQAGDIDAATPGGGESLREVFQRFLPAMREIIAKHAGQEGTLVIVAHGGVLASGLTQLFANITPEFVLGHMFDNTATATGAFVDGALVCTDWHGVPPE
ncbi:MAG TPA: histidine phosphatase family protein [Thermomicrobiales bacterium]|nr:histidine phosphatase family protein [Thermomicrobiales bacterium]